VAHDAPADTSPDVRALERVVAGRYAIERELGRGGMGVVLLARDLSLDRPVALKLLPARRLDDAQASLRTHEADVLRALAESGGDRPVGHELDARRATLLAGMRDAPEHTRSRRATITAALENVRIQLLRLGAGIGDVDDMHDEIATLKTLAADAHAAPAAALRA
jgi:serine/threonine protein kinase